MVHEESIIIFNKKFMVLLLQLVLTTSIRNEKYLRMIVRYRQKHARIILYKNFFLDILFTLKIKQQKHTCVLHFKGILFTLKLNGNKAKKQD